jgi:hypothetical protein
VKSVRRQALSRAGEREAGGQGQGRRAVCTQGTTIACSVATSVSRVSSHVVATDRDLAAFQAMRPAI